mmetsp:Transcript_69299/g.133706  ORF Transcript_69299/g.133706 Transcript_69299/m.133706 type:complete len:170 (+) Transcript_69299:51-560(+)
MAEEEGQSWDATIEEWLTAEGKCCAAGMAQQADGAFYAAAPQADEKGWGYIWKDPHEETITADDGVSEEKMTINEAAALLAVATTGQAPKGGLWLGGKKYTVTQKNMAEEHKEVTFKYVFAAASKCGVHIVATESQITCGFYSEEEGQTAGNAKAAVFDYAEYLIGINM